MDELDQQPNYRHRLKWAAIVIACASPVAAAMWNNLDVSGRVGMVIGIAGWVAAVVPIERVIQRRQSTVTSRDLMTGAALVLAIEAFGALALPLYFLAFYWPAVMVAAWLELVPNTASDLVPAFVMTALCGAQALACAYLFGQFSRLARIGLHTLIDRPPATVTR